MAPEIIMQYNSPYSGGDVDNAIAEVDNLIKKDGVIAAIQEVNDNQSKRLSDIENFLGKNSDTGFNNIIKYNTLSQDVDVLEETVGENSAAIDDQFNDIEIFYNSLGRPQDGKETTQINIDWKAAKDNFDEEQTALNNEILSALGGKKADKINFNYNNYKTDIENNFKAILKMLYGNEAYPNWDVSYNLNDRLNSIETSDDNAVAVGQRLNTFAQSITGLYVQENGEWVSKWPNTENLGWNAEQQKGTLLKYLNAVDSQMAILTAQNKENQKRISDLENNISAETLTDTHVLRIANEGE